MSQSNTTKYVILGAAAVAVAGGLIWYSSQKSSSNASTTTVTEKPAVDTKKPQQETTTTTSTPVKQPVQQQQQVEEKWAEYKNEKFGIKFNHPGVVVIEKADLFPLIKICSSQEADCFSHVIIQPHDGSVIDEFLNKAFAEVKDRLKIDVKTLSRKNIKLDGKFDAVEVEYQYVYPAPVNQNVSYWSLVTAANNNIYFFQHFSPQLKDIATAKKIASSITLFDAKSNGSLSVQAQYFELELPSLLFRPSKSPTNALVDLVTMNDTQIVKSVKIAPSAAASLEKLVQEHASSKNKPSEVSGFAFANRALNGKAFAYTNSTGQYVDVLFSGKDSKLYTASLFSSNGSDGTFQATALTLVANLKVLEKPVSASTFVYVNKTSGFKTRFPTSNLTLFTEHIDEDPVVTFMYSDLCETNISCITPDAPATGIDQVKQEVTKGLLQDEEGSTVTILESNTKRVNNVDCVQFVYVQQMLYSQVSFKWMLTSFLHKNRVYHIRSYAYEDAWKPELVDLFTNIVTNFELQ